jgi:hypothetical protein
MLGTTFTTPLIYSKILVFALLIENTSLGSNVFRPSRAFRLSSELLEHADKIDVECDRERAVDVTHG